MAAHPPPRQFDAPAVLPSACVIVAGVRGRPAIVPPPRLRPPTAIIGSVPMAATSGRFCAKPVITRPTTSVPEIPTRRVENDDSPR
jgi:hypothetical protein